jgi:PAS domain S-box-containing protein
MQEFAQEWGGIIASIVAVGTLIALLRRTPSEIVKNRADARRSWSEADAAAARTTSTLISDVNALRRDLNETRQREDQCRERLDAAEDALAKMVERVAVLETTTPMVMVALKLQAITVHLARVLNKNRDGLVLSVPAEEGRLVWCNTAFASALGMTCEEVIATGWRALIHPDDREVTDANETRAWQRGGEVVNRYRHKLGHYVTLRWFFAPYDEGSSLSVVWFERRRESGAMPPAPMADN